MHIDMDCFFVSVGLRNLADLKGKPVAVTHAKRNQPRAGREVSSISFVVTTIKMGKQNMTKTHCDVSG